MKKPNIPGLESHWTSPQPLRAEEFLWDRDSNDFSQFYCRDFIVYLEFLTILNNEHTRYTFTQPLSVQMERLHLLPITTLLYLVIFKIIIFTLRVTEPLTKLQSTTYNTLVGESLNLSGSKPRGWVRSDQTQSLNLLQIQREEYFLREKEAFYFNIIEGQSQLNSIMCQISANCFRLKHSWSKQERERKTHIQAGSGKRKDGFVGCEDVWI